MPDKWMSLAEAASALKVHPRTIERRIAGGKIQTRRADDGLLQVLIDLPDTSDTPPDTAIEAVRELAADQVTLAKGSASALVRFAQDDAERTRHQLDIVRQDVGRARRGALAAWCVVAILGLGVTVAVGWTTSTITRARADVRTLNERAERIQQEKDKLQADHDDLMKEAQAARLAAAESAGRLAALKEASDNRPTTRPATLVQRIAAVIAEP